MYIHIYIHMRFRVSDYWRIKWKELENEMETLVM